MNERGANNRDGDSELVLVVEEPEQAVVLQGVPLSTFNCTDLSHNASFVRNRLVFFINQLGVHIVDIFSGETRILSVDTQYLYAKQVTSVGRDLVVISGDYRAALFRLNPSMSSLEELGCLTEEFQLVYERAGFLENGLVFNEMQLCADQTDKTRLIVYSSETGIFSMLKIKYTRLNAIDSPDTLCKDVYFFGLRNKFVRGLKKVNEKWVYCEFNLADGTSKLGEVIGFGTESENLLENAYCWTVHKLCVISISNANNLYRLLEFCPSDNEMRFTGVELKERPRCLFVDFCGYFILITQNRNNVYNVWQFPPRRVLSLQNLAFRSVYLQCSVFNQESYERVSNTLPVGLRMQFLEDSVGCQEI